METIAKLSCRIVRSADEFGEVADTWHALYVRAGCATPSLTSAAVAAFLAHRVRPRQRPLVILASTSTALVAALPLVSFSYRGTKAMRTFSDLHTYGVDLLVDPAWHGVALEQIMGALLGECPHLYSLRFEDIPAHSGTIKALQHCKGVLYHIEPHRCASYLPVPHKEEEINGSISRNFRKNLRKQEARLRLIPEVQFSMVGSADARVEHFEQFVALEASGWKGTSGTAVGRSDSLVAYYRDLTTRLADAGQLEWHFLYAEHRLIAAHLAVRLGTSLALLKIGYDEAYAACAPGNMLFLALLRRESAQASRHIVDCLTDMPWHRNWNMASREFVTVTVYPRKPWSLLTGYLPVRIKEFLMRSPILRALVRRARHFLRSFRR